MSTSNIRFPQGPIVGPGGYITLEWQQWFQRPEFLSLLVNGQSVPAAGGTSTGGGAIAPDLGGGGEEGEQGFPGPIGPKGDTGAQGIPGIVGYDGEDGQTIAGPQGAQGPAGVLLVRMVEDAQGEDGASIVGPQGPVGAAGPMGMPGADGLDGSGDSIQLGVPSISDPVLGSFAPGSFNIPTGKYAVMSALLQLAGAEVARLEGTAILRIT